MVSCSATATKAHKLKTSSKTGWMKCSQPSLSPTWRHPHQPAHFGHLSVAFRALPERHKYPRTSRARAVVLYKGSVNPQTPDPNLLKAFSWEVLHSPFLMASAPTASRVTATSRTPLTDITFSTGIPLPTKPNPESPNEGFCDSQVPPS